MRIRINKKGIEISRPLQEITLCAGQTFLAHEIADLVTQYPDSVFIIADQEQEEQGQIGFKAGANYEYPHEEYDIDEEVYDKIMQVLKG